MAAECETNSTCLHSKGLEQGISNFEIRMAKCSIRESQSPLQDDWLQRSEDCKSEVGPSTLRFWAGIQIAESRARPVFAKKNVTGTAFRVYGLGFLAYCLWFSTVQNLSHNHRPISNGGEC